MAKKKGNSPQLSVRVKGLPLVNILIGGIFLLGAYAGYSFTLVTELPPLFTIIIGLFIAAIGVLLSMKTMRSREREWKNQLEQFLKRFEKEDEESRKAQEEGSQVFSVFYMGGHPNCKVASDKDYGNLTVSDRQVAFRATRFSRFALKMARLKKVTIETEATLIVKKIKNIHLKPVTVEEKKKLAGKIKAELRKRMKYLLFEYQDDLGERLQIVFQPIGGNPLEAKTIKEAIDYNLNRHRMMRKKEESKASNTPSSSSGPLAPDPMAEPLSRNTPRPGPSPVQPQRNTPRPGTVRNDGLPTFDLPTPTLVGPQIEAMPAPPPTKATGIFRTADLLAAMKEQRYDVIVLGAKEEKAQVVERMAQQFGILPEQALLVLEKTPYVAKKSLTYSEAELLASSFLSVGAQATIEATK